MKSSSNTVDVGFVARAHGIRGALRVRASIDLSQLSSLTIGERSYRLVRAQRDKDDWLVTVEGVGDRTAAEGLRGQPIRVDRDAIDVADDELLVADLIGCVVVDGAGTTLGTVSGSFETPAHEVLEVARAGGGSFMLPFVEPIVTDVDLEARRIVCDPPEGLIDLDAVPAVGSDEDADGSGS